jgi:hypothetical protein
VPEAFARYRLSNPPEYGPGTGPARLIAGEDLVHDTTQPTASPTAGAIPVRRALVELGGARTILNVALRKDSALLGTISIYRQEVRPFSDNQIALLQAFARPGRDRHGECPAAGELRQRTDDLQESLGVPDRDQRVLEVISRSTSDLHPVLDTMLAAAARLCGVQKGDISIRQGEAFRCVTSLGAGPDELAWLNQRVLTPGRTMTPARAWMERQVVQVLDQSLGPRNLHPRRSQASPNRPRRAVAARGRTDRGHHAGARQVDGVHASRQVALIRTFADQAVIAMENARLLGELRQRTDDLQESLEYQTAIGEVLTVISRVEPSISTPCLQTLTETALRLCEAEMASSAAARADAFAS